MNKKGMIVAIIIVLCVGACAAGLLMHMSNQQRAQYDEAVRLSAAGDLDGAYAIFDALGAYRDAEQQCAALIERDALLPYRTADKGDIVVFGHYEQDNDLINGPEPIEWIVLDRIDDQLLLLSSTCLEGRAYNEESFAPVTWETCTLRAWLNGSFMEQAFTEDERAMIPVVENRNEDHSTAGTPGGKPTEDRAFLLSESDTVIYLTGEYAQNSFGRAMATDYAMANGLQVDEDGCCSWWLRSPGMYEYIAQFVDQKGVPYPNGGSTDINYMFGVRPAIWLNLKSTGVE